MSHQNGLLGLNRLILHIPLIEYVPGGAEALPPPLKQALAAGHRTRQDPGRALSTLLDAGPLPSPAVLAAMAQPDLFEGGHRRHWLRFDPVRLVPDLTAVWVDRPMPLDFGAEALRPIVEELQVMFDREGLAWKPRSEGFGLLQLDATPDCSFMPPDMAYGKSLDEVLPTGQDASRWRRLINESQMVFHQFRASDRADQQGVGLWFWGAGGPPKPACCTGTVTVVEPAGDAEVHGLARWLEASLLDADARLDDLDSDRLYVHWPLQGANVGAALQQLGRLWVRPALRNLRRGRLAELAIVGSSGFWRLGRLSSLAFWRRSIEGIQQPGDAR